MKFKHRELTKEEYDKAIIRILDELDKPLKIAGKHRKKDWIRGWKRDGKYPGYFGKHLIQRLNGKLIMPFSKNYEIKALYSVLDPLFKKYLASGIVYEFGCGTGHNLLRLEKICPKTYPIGFDWANDKFSYFDFFEPKGNIQQFCKVFTVAALEQTGDKYIRFVQWLMKQKPSIVVHVEPIGELLNENNLLDYLSLKYFKKRGYLCKYLTYLKRLERKGKIKIVEAKRSGVGSLFIEGYSIIAWYPL